jgi:hypothetical protein
MPRPTIFTKAALVHVTSLVDQGRSAAEIATEIGCTLGTPEIATEIGCTLGTLRVRCSQFGISLRRRATGSRKEATTAMDLVHLAQASAAARPESVERVNTVEQSRTVVTESSADVRIELKVLLPRTTAEQLRQRGALRGISGSTLASELLVTIIAGDSLYDAVLDGG